MVVAIIDIIFCTFRGAGLLLSVASVAVQQRQGLQNPAGEYLAFEVATGAAVVLFGLLANAGMLFKAGWAVIPGYLAVASTVASCAVGVWTALTMAPHVMEQAAGIEGGGPPPQVLGTIMIVTAVLTTLARLAILVVYVVALVKYARWFARRNTESLHAA